MVSVVVPTFNRKYCLGRAINSALCQTHGNVEVLVVDDGSSDGTDEFVRAQYGHNDKVRYFIQEHKRAAAARNLGIAQARGEFIAFLDSDDVWMPWKLEAQMACMATLPELGLVWTDMEAIDATGTVVDPAYIRSFYGCYRRYSLEEIFRDRRSLRDLVASQSRLPESVTRATLFSGPIFPYMFLGNLVHTSTTLVRRQALERVGGFNEQVGQCGEDYDLFLRLSSTVPMGFLQAASIQYQTDMPDRSTQINSKCRFAKNCLTAITWAVENRRPELNLSAMTIRRRFAYVHGWLAESLLLAGERRQSWQQFLRSLQYQPWQPRRLRLFALSLLPERIDVAIRRMYRRIKGKPV